MSESKKEEKKEEKTEVVPVRSYVHRMMRVKPDRNIRIGVRRFRANEIVDCDIPDKNKDDVTQVE